MKETFHLRGAHIYNRIYIYYKVIMAEEKGGKRKETGSKIEVTRRGRFIIITIVITRITTTITMAIKQ